MRLHVAQRADAEDVVQDVLTARSGSCPGSITTSGRVPSGPGCGRSRSIACGGTGRTGDGRPAAAGGPEQRAALDQLADPASELARGWDEEHDRHITRTLLASIRLEFQPATWRAFQRQVQDGFPAADDAGGAGPVVNAVLIAKSRVLKRLREKAEGLVDDS